MAEQQQQDEDQVVRPAARQHRRRTSEPPPEFTSLLSTNNSTTAAMTTPTPVDRRQWMERAQSTNNVFRSRSSSVSSSSHHHHHHTNNRRNLLQQQAPSQRASFRITDISAFQDSWTTAGAASTTSDAAAAATATCASVASLWGSTTSISTLPTVVTSTSTTSSTITTDSHDRAASAIHDAARIFDWDAVLRLCNTTTNTNNTNQHPAGYAGRDGWTAVHHAAGRRCPRPDVVEALCQSSPHSLEKSEPENGWLPLHLACRFKAPAAVVQLLVQHYPAAVSRCDRQGRTPLYLAIRYDAPAGVLEILLQQDPSVVLGRPAKNDNTTTDSTNNNMALPLVLVWDSWAEKTAGKRIVQQFLPGGYEEEEDTPSTDDVDSSAAQRAVRLRQRLRQEPALLKRWNMANRLLKAAFGYPVQSDDADAETTMEDEDADDNTNNNKQQRTWRIVHATAAIQCHLSLFLLACALHPEQVAELDQHDLQLAIAAKKCSSNNTTETSLSYPTKQTALHLAAASPATGETGKAVLLTLLSLYRPAASIADDQGQLPLHCCAAAAHSKNWSQHAAILYHFNPVAVQVADSNGRLPLHLAAAANVGNANNNNNQDAGDDENEQNDDDNNNNNNAAAASSVVQELIRAFPQAASRADAARNLPLHLAAANSRTWNDNLEALVEAHPNAVWAANAAGALPLHLAAANAGNATDASLITRLLELHPAAASVRDGAGRCPLHLAAAAASTGKCTAGVLALYRAFPEAIRVAVGVEGWLPLHLACAAVATDTSTTTPTPVQQRQQQQPRHENDNDAEVEHDDENDNAPVDDDNNDAADESSSSLIAHLVRLYPAAASIPEHGAGGRYPLHLACAAGRPWGDLHVLLQADATVAATPDATGHLPLVCAALRFCQCDQDEDDNDTTTSMASSRKVRPDEEEPEPELDVLFQLLRADPTILP